MPDLLIFVVLVAVVAVVGIRLGILMSSRVSRIADRLDAEPADPPPGTEPRDDA